MNNFPVSFRPMTTEDFKNFIAYFVPDYAREISQNYGDSESNALHRAKQELEDDLPDGAETPGHDLWCIMKDTTQNVVGYLWHKSAADMKSAFIYDFYIFPQFQNLGLGKQALSLLEKQLADQGIVKIQLRVAHNNIRAKHVYDRSGFRVTGINMCKNIG